MECMKISIEKIEQNENSRVVYKEQDLAELMMSMRKHGLLQPVGVRKMPGGKYDAVFGNRRILAAKKLGWDEIDCHVVDAADEVDRDILGLIENIKRKNTTLAEDGRMFKLLMDRGLSAKEIGSRLDISSDRVQAALDVVSYVPVEYQRIMPNRGTPGPGMRGQISPTVTHKIMNLRKSHGLNRKQTRQLLEKAKDGMTIPQMDRLAPMLAAGKPIAMALRNVDKIRRVQVEVMISIKESQELEKKYGKSIRGVLTDYLVDSGKFKTIEPLKPEAESA